MRNLREMLGSVLKAADKRVGLSRTGKVAQETVDPVRMLELTDLLRQLYEVSSIMEPYLGNDPEAYKSPVGRKKEALELELKRRYEGGLLSADQEAVVKKLGYVSWERKQK